MKIDAIRARHVLKYLGLQDTLPREITYLEEAEIIREACKDDITLAARCGLSLTETGTVTSYIGKHSRTLAKALENTARFHDLFDPTLLYTVRMSGNAASMEFTWKDPSFRRFHRHTEFLMFPVLARMRVLTQIDFFPLEMRFDHDVGNSSAFFPKIGGFPVVFGAESPEIILSLSSLELLIPTYDPALRDHLMAYSERLLAESNAPAPSLKAKIEGHIIASLPGYVPSANEIASTLGMSDRTFARRLKDEGLSYRGIVDELRYDLAQTFMKDSMSLSEVAFTLGYSTQAAFSTAFKRWSGHAPSGH